MEDFATLLDTIVLLAGVALILLTIVRVSRRRSGGRPVKGQTSAIVGISVWLACLGVAFYLIFG
jgi:hypothetical protein